MHARVARSRPPPCRSPLLPHPSGMAHLIEPSAPTVKTLVLEEAISRISPVKSLTTRVSLGVEKVVSHCFR